MTTNGTTPPLTETELAEIDDLVARAPGHVDGARATLREQHEAHAKEQERGNAEHWEIGTRYAGADLRVAIARAEALAIAGRLLADLRRAQKRIADLEAIPTIGPCKCAEPHVVDGLIPACAVCAQPISFYRLSSATVTGLATVEIEQCRKRIAELEAQIAATAEAHREDQRRTDELAGVPG